MSPTTNIGSSTPIDSSGQNLGSDLRRKVINDAVASLTGARGRQSPQHDVAGESRARGVEPHGRAGAADERDRLHRARHSPPSSTSSTATRRRTRNAPSRCISRGREIDTVKPGFITRFLNTIINPNLISLLFLLGIVGLIFEVLHPGVVLPGALGAVCLVLALYGFSVLTPSWGGLALMLLGVALLVVDLHAPTHGVLTAGGLISLLFGLALLFQNEPGVYRVNLWLIIGIGGAIGIFWVFATGKALAARRLPVETGVQTMVGQMAEVRGPGLVFVDGALWQAHAADDSELVPGEEVEGRRRSTGCS